MTSITRESIETRSVAEHREEAPRADVMTPALAVDVETVNILIVDDEPRNLCVLETVLVNPRYRLVRAESADEALLALVAEEFALIILDIQLPGMNGFELAELIKQRKKTAEVPIIFLTAYYSDDQHVLEGYNTGAVDYLHKPINPTVLRSKVAVFIELYLRKRECELAAKKLLGEVAERCRAQDELLLLNQELERRVDERTLELLKASAALSESEERLRLANEASGTGLWEWNIPTDRVTWSPECYAIYGRVRGEFDGTLERFFELVHPDDRSRVRENFFDALNKRNVYGCDFRIIRPDGTVRWVTNKGRVFFDGNNAPLRMIGTIIDISFRKETELQLLDADRRKNEFLATLSHELRNPLAPIRNAVQILLLSGIEDANLRWATDVIDRQLRQMTRLVDDLLEVSRITTGKLEVRKDTVDLGAVIRDAVETSLPLIEQDGHRLTASLPPDSVLVNADRIRLAQVFSNLLNNAAKYTERGGDIGISLEVVEDCAVVSVKDSGIGIAAEMLPHIFEMFMQVDRKVNRAKGGLGIGLTLVKRLVEMQGGKIEARSMGTGHGSEFVVRMPTVAAREPEAQELPAHPAANNATTLRILVVDDNEDGANSLGQMLEMMGNEVQVAHDGLAAIEAAAVFRPQMILLDIGMPKLDGYDTCRRIRKEPWGKDMVLIALTGWGQDEDRRRTHEVGFDYHLVKPVEPDMLVNILAEVAHRQRETSNR
ncbi:MAG TPA: response regulator [Pirellulales bacterium]|jgi:PAS domain S-box-containing protein|nr:response regulator [Pirellulales bacterium]